jgi:hypothetical protein
VSDRTRPALSARTVDGAGAGACALLLVLAYLLGLAPELRERAEASERRALLDQRRVELSTFAGERRERTGAAQDLEARIAAGSLRLHDVRAVNTHVNTLVELAQACGLRIGEISPDAPTPAGKYSVVLIRIRGSGGYSGVAEFLARLHRDAPDTAVWGFTLGAAEGRRAEFSVDLAWHAAPDGATGTAAPARAN